MNKTDEERDEFNSYPVTLLNCSPANWDRPDGEPVSVVTIGRSNLIEPLSLPLRDTRTLVTQLLVCLATYNDEFAKKLLDDHFAWDDEGDFQWPEGTPDCM